MELGRDATRQNTGRYRNNLPNFRKPWRWKICPRKSKCTALPAKTSSKHTQTHREKETQYNSNTLGLSRSVAPQYDKEGALKGSTITLITNGGALSTIEFLSNVQAAADALRRILENKTQRTPEHCPNEPLSAGNTYIEGERLKGGFS